MDPATLHDIQDREDIADLVTAFYRSAFADELLGPIFIDIAKMDLEAHMPIMCDFWETVLFQTGAYRRNAFQIHLHLHQMVPLTQVHFQRWEDLWHQTVDEMFAGDKANLAKVNASRIANSIRRRLERSVDRELISIQPRRILSS
jgi:hemoglobin